MVKALLAGVLLLVQTLRVTSSGWSGKMESGILTGASEVVLREMWTSTGILAEANGCLGDMQGLLRL